MPIETDAKNKIELILKDEDVVKFLIEALKNEAMMIKNYGYDLYVTRAMDRWLITNMSVIPKPDGWSTPEHYIANIPYISEVFYAAAWDLCRLGILRPGVRYYDAQSTEDGGAGNGYSLTPFGKKWLEEADGTLYVPTEPGRFSEMISPFCNLFGDGFKSRSNEAIRCYGAHAYLSCCVMCGAAAESILLHLAIKKDGDEDKILKVYRAGNGRKRMEEFISSVLKDSFKTDFIVNLGLLKYWRDETAHGRPTLIKDNEAYTSLALLLRFAQFAKDNYSDLTECRSLRNK
ncbi:MAG: hypothetical protein PHS79_03460 [Patescibacteria group bacterium]|nr:hypothetical protein [Patescibacteria group bacterium]